MQCVFSAVDVILLPGSSPGACETSWHAPSAACVSDSGQIHFLACAPSPSDRGSMPQENSLPQISTDEWLDKKRLFDQKAESDWSQLALMSGRAKAERERFLKHFLVVYVKGELDVGLPLQRNAEFSCAVAVMDKFGGWEEGNEREDQIERDLGQACGSTPKPWFAMVKDTWKTS